MIEYVTKDVQPNMNANPTPADVRHTETPLCFSTLPGTRTVFSGLRLRVSRGTHATAATTANNDHEPNDARHPVNPTLSAASAKGSASSGATPMATWLATKNVVETPGPDSGSRSAPPPAWPHW